MAELDNRYITRYYHSWFEDPPGIIEHYFYLTYHLFYFYYLLFYISIYVCLANWQENKDKDILFKNFK